MSGFTTFTSQNAPAGLDFSVEQPGDWVFVPLPAESHDFTDVLHFAPVAVLMAPYAPVVFAVAARPGYASVCEAFGGLRATSRGELPAGAAAEPLVAGFAASFLTGCLACRFMLEIDKRGRLIWFAAYCAAAGIVSIASYLIR